MSCLPESEDGAPIILHRNDQTRETLPLDPRMSSHPICLPKCTINIRRRKGRRPKHLTPLFHGSPPVHESLRLRLHLHSLPSTLNHVTMSFLLFLCISQLLSLSFASSPIPPQTNNAPAPRLLHLTAISAANGASTLECWQLTAPFAVSSTPGQAGSAVLSLGNTSSASYTVLPAGFDGGLHHAPAVQ